MARYTELLSEYLEDGGQLPAVFSQIEGFEDIFKAYYIDHEIGFETPALFAIKLEAKANLVIPMYAGKIAAYNQTIEQLQNPQKVRTRTGSQTNTRTGSLTRAYGKDLNKEFDLPINYVGTDVNSSPPQAAQEREAREDTETYNTITDKLEFDGYSDTETGVTTNEALAKLEALTTQIKSLLEQCVEEFKNLFMGVYL